MYINHYKNIIEDKEKTLSHLKYLGEKILKQIESSGKEDLRLRVFIKAYVEGKSNNELLDEMPEYALQTIWNIKTEINGLIRTEDHYINQVVNK